MAAIQKNVMGGNSGSSKTNNMVTILETKKRKTEGGMDHEGNVGLNTELGLDSEGDEMDQDLNNGPKNLYGTGSDGQTPPSIISILSWNCRVLWTPWAVQFLKEMILRKKLNFIFLSKKLCNINKVERVRHM